MKYRLNQLCNNREIAKFLFVGVINTLFYYLIYSALIFFGLNYVVSVVSATVVGVIFNFFTFGKYVFSNTMKSLIYRFILVYLVLMGINLIFIKLFFQIINNYYIAGFLAIFPYAIFSYVLNKRFVFNQKETNELYR